MTADQLYDLLVENEMIAEGAKPNSSGEYICKCFNCDKKKLFVKCPEDNDDDIGVYFCQSCEVKGKPKDFEERFTPLSEEQEVYKAFHEYAVRKLLANDDAWNTLIDRDFNEDDIKEFGFGYVGKNFAADLTKSGITPGQLKEFGFISPKGMPVFWNHIIIPYIDGNSYTNFKGRCLDEDAKVKYIGLSGHESGIYGEADLRKKGRVFLTEGEFKRAYLKANGYNAASLSGANNFAKYLPTLRKVDDLWIILDSDQPTEKNPLGVGQAAAIKIASELPRCHVVFLPLGDEKKVGVDDYLVAHGPEEFDVLLSTADYYVDGDKQKSRALAVVMDDWIEQAKRTDLRGNISLGYERLDDWLDGGLEPGALGYVIGSAHNGKTSILRGSAYNAYHCNKDCFVEYHSNDDSQAMTIGRLVAMAGKFDSSDAKHPMTAFADQPKLMKRWIAATNKIKAMSDRMKVLDRSYRISLEDIYKDIYNWRQTHADTPRVLFIDGFRQQYSRATKGITDKMIQIEIKSEQLKSIAQELNIAVLATIEPPKLYGKRPRSFDIAFGNASEFDADYIFTAYIEAQSKGLPNTDLKMEIEYEDYPSLVVPYVELGLVKNKPADHLDTDVFIIDPRTSTLEELDDEEHKRALHAIYDSQSKEREK